MSLQKYLHRNSVGSSKNHHHLYIRQPLTNQIKPKVTKRKVSKEKATINTDEQYETDIRQKGQSDTDLQLQQLRRIVASCEHCRRKLPEFITKKRKDSQGVKKSEGVQTESNLALFQMLQQKLDEIQRCNTLVMKELDLKDRQIQSKQEQLVDIEERFTRLIYKVSQDMFLAERITKQYNELKAYSKLCDNIPSYLKALTLDDFVKGCADG